MPTYGWMAAGVSMPFVGEQTREHRDLDLVVKDAHESRMREVLAAHAFTQVDEDFVGNFVLADGRGREVDVHPVRFDDRGNGHLLSEDGKPFGHSTEAFAVTGSVSGYRVARLSADAQMSNHSWGYEPARPMSTICDFFMTVWGRHFWGRTYRTEPNLNHVSRSPSLMRLTGRQGFPQDGDPCVARLRASDHRCLAPYSPTNLIPGVEVLPPFGEPWRIQPARASGVDQLLANLP
jgi:lincosamide nucleotidyltransferase A/C/D/E